MKTPPLSIVACGLLLAIAAGCTPSSGEPAPQASSPGTTTVASVTTAPPAALPAAVETSAVTNDTPASPAKVVKSDEEWRKALTDEQFFVARQAGTERPYSSPLTTEKKAGDYRCVGCNELLFTSDGKFDSHCGWPSFFKPDDKFKVGQRVDRAHGMVRTEVFCNKCGAHLGHVFEDAPDQPGGLRYCINGVVLKFTPKDEPAKK